MAKIVKIRAIIPYSIRLDIYSVSCYTIHSLKTLKYQKLLVTELDEIKARVGEERMKEIYAELKVEGQEAMSRELVIQMVSRYFGFWQRVQYLARHLDLVIPFLFRIKPTSTRQTENEL